MNFVTKEPINKGWSSDKKYCVTDENGTRYLLRVSDIAQHDTKQSEFNMMKQVASFGVPMCQPIEFGTCEDGVYSIQSWIDGEDAEQVMSDYKTEYQHCIDEPYSRLIHSLQDVSIQVLPQGYSLYNATLKDYAEHINSCYSGIGVTEADLLNYTARPVYDSALWLAIKNNKTNEVGATGIAELDKEIGEGVLEWIQVSEQHRGYGLDKYAVSEFL